eukprot:TRINITY_DN4263_c0_g6_i2.p1 TRINITY_DN4263_c0_g6~~TRINITY_DN4263_c0_g6_i2.p1  ORF type:complete len:226 (+),score=34.99 TRINITY_DN4263_c0_g6_i2:3-680(+)
MDVINVEGFQFRLEFVRGLYFLLETSINFTQNNYNNMAQNINETQLLNRGLAKMLEGGVIMDVINVEQALVAERSGAVAVMALEKVPADIRKDGGICRSSDPQMILDIMEAVSIPVMAKVRIGHFAEAQILQSMKVDYIDESEVLSIADQHHHIQKTAFKIPFVCGARNLGEALRRIQEGASMIRTKGEAGTGIHILFQYIYSNKGMYAKLLSMFELLMMKSNEQ